MKKIHFAFLGLTLLAGVVLFSAFSDKKDQKDIPDLYFRYIPNDNDEEAFGVAGSWDYAGTVQPTSGCDELGTDACVVILPSTINSTIDPTGMSPEELEEAFAELLDSFGDTDPAFDDASQYVQQHVLATKS